MQKHIYSSILLLIVLLLTCQFAVAEDKVDLQLNKGLSCSFQDNGHQILTTLNGSEKKAGLILRKKKQVRSRLKKRILRLKKKLSAISSRDLLQSQKQDRQQQRIERIQSSLEKLDLRQSVIEMQIVEIRACKKGNKEVLFPTPTPTPLPTPEPTATATPIPTPERVSPGRVLNFEVEWEKNFTKLPLDAAGWSQLSPSADSRIIYVSNSDGNDDTAEVYQTSSPEVGAQVTLPSGNIRAFKTLTGALNQARSGEADWILLKKGDEWVSSSSLNMLSGRSATERFVITTYGSELSRPRVRTGSGGGVRWTGAGKFSALIGIEFYADGRDPNSPTFLGFNNISNANGFAFSSRESAGPLHTVLIEDCRFEFYANNTVQGSVPNYDIVIRRSQFLNNYSNLSHSQGMYSKSASILLEENLFDHNGWYKQQIDGGNDKFDGQGTFFNHNTYFTNTRNTIFRRNIFSRPSSIGTKFTSNSSTGVDEVNAFNILMDNNLYVDTEVAISAGGNTNYDTGYRWKNMYIINNVFTQLGESRPTNRALAWGAEANDWDTGAISGNYFTSYEPNTKNIFAIHVKGHSRDILISSNLVYDLRSGRPAFKFTTTHPKDNITVADNYIQLAGSDMSIFDTEFSFPEGTFSANKYFTDKVVSEWFRFKGTYLSFDEWKADTGDTSEVEQVAFPDPDRNVATYHASLSKTASLVAFIEEAKKSSKANWKKEYTAEAVNNYIREGFLLDEK